MTTPLFPGPPLHNLPLSRGGDLDVTLVWHKTVDPDTGQTAITDWPAGVTVVLTIDAKTGPVSGTAIITGPAARIHIDHALSTTSRRAPCGARAKSCPTTRSPTISMTSWSAGRLCVTTGSRHD